MWLVCTFDLPVTDAAARKRYTIYRKLLLAEGFNMVQNSVYARHFPALSDARRAAQRYGKNVPPDGKVDFYFITDQQMGATLSFYGPAVRRETAHEPVEQGELF
jgi:CRISPR-associated protein Cas2